ncbi:MAG: uracil-DNA glycosylase [Flavobacteriales bacterium]|nr:uracil-DNA glycosylase [Flavobacteriales bacterium]MBL6869120.1 uracil-DNA glycosylase [Flavobacteriales bacterium]
MNTKQLHREWISIFEKEFSKKYFQKINSEVNNCSSNKLLCPKKENIFKAFEKTNFTDLKIVILGQDPYHGNDQANGLAFAVNENQKTPPSLRNIFKEIKNDLNHHTQTKKNLEFWAKQGVLLLNSSLTVKLGTANSHSNLGWDLFTNNILKEISLLKNKVVFILWGNYAQKKEILIDFKKHLILKAPHPSPLSAYRGFFGCKHFSKANEFLKSNHLKEIIW